MAQTTGGMSSRNAKIEGSANNSDWTDLSGSVNLLEVKGGDRKTGEAYTASGEYPIVTMGKMEGMSIDVTAVYSESASEAAMIAYNAKVAGTAYYLRYAPAGATSGNLRWTTGIGYVSACLPPPINVAEAAPILTKFTWSGNTITAAAIA